MYQLHLMRRLGLLALVVVLAGAVPLIGARPQSASQELPEKVELFAAIEAGQIDVRMIVRDSTQASVLIANRTEKPLAIRLPEVFAGVPILAQFGNNDNNNDRNDRNNSNQGVGGGMGGGMGGMMGGMGGGFFNVAPEKIAKIKVAAVCLEHGKKEPNSRITYEIQPLEKLQSSPGVLEVCSMLGNGVIDQRAAQAAAWHLANQMSWQQLAAKYVKRASGRREPYFNRLELIRGVQIVQEAKRRTELRKNYESTGKLPNSDTGRSQPPATPGQ